MFGIALLEKIEKYATTTHTHFRNDTVFSVIDFRFPLRVCLEAHWKALMSRKTIYVCVYDSSLPSITCITFYLQLGDLLLSTDCFFIL